MEIEDLVQHLSYQNNRLQITLKQALVNKNVLNRLNDIERSVKSDHQLLKLIVEFLESTLY